MEQELSARRNRSDHQGFRAKNRSDVANGGNVVLADGRKLFVGSSNAGAPYDEPGKK